MLFNNLTTERRSSLIVKDSRFYIELAKFVQAYTTIVKNPNEFLSEINEPAIDSKKQHLTWEQLVKIMQTCELGFKHIPTKMELIVYYNYALDMGSVKALEKKIASVDQVAEAQKHYYNFVDEEKASVEEEYLKQKKIYEARQREMNYVDGKIASQKTKNVLLAMAMFLSVVIGIVGIVSFFVDNALASAIGKIIPIWKPQYVGGIVLIALMIFLFWLTNKYYVKTKYEYVKLKNASVTIFAREDEMLAKQNLLKKKLDEVSKDYKTVLREINDKNKTFDVKHNIEVLKTTNKFYQKLCEVEELSAMSEKTALESANLVDEDFAPIKLNKEYEENVKTVRKEVIGLAGQFDTEAYNEKFEKSTKKKSSEKDEKEAEIKEDKELSEDLKKQKMEQEKQGFQESIDYVRELLGINQENSAKEK